MTILNKMLRTEAGMKTMILGDFNLDFRDSRDGRNDITGNGNEYGYGYGR